MDDLYMILRHFPKPPASIFIQDCEMEGFANDLLDKGYQVDMRGAPRERNGALTTARDEVGADMYGNGSLNLDRCEVPSKRFDVFMAKVETKGVSLLAVGLDSARRFLKDGGLYIMIADAYRNPSGGNNSGSCRIHEMIKLLYEAGFSIKSSHIINGTVHKRACEIGPNSRRGDPPDWKPTAFTSHRFEKAISRYGPVSFWKSRRFRHHEGEEGFNVIVASKDGIFLRPYRHGDEKAILPMFNRVFNVKRTMDHWNWKFRDNPFGDYKIALAVDRGQTIAAHFSAYPVPFYSSFSYPREFVAFHGGDTMTDPAFRRHGLGPTSVLGRTADYFFHHFCVEGVPFMYGYNTGNIKKLGERFFGYQYMSHIPYHVLDLLRSPQKLTKAPKKFFCEYKVEKTNTINSAFNRLFERACDEYGFLVKRDSHYLKWRYVDCPDPFYQIFVVKHFGRLIGWSVFCKRGDSLIWGDAMFQRRYPESVKLLLEQVLRFHFSDVKSIIGWFSKKPAWWSDILMRLGFEVRSEPDLLTPGVTLFDDAFSLDFFDQNFYYTLGDSDLF
jgi:hypothetical protein